MYIKAYVTIVLAVREENGYITIEQKLAIIKC